jgi:hypothetical protein
MTGREREREMPTPAMTGWESRLMPGREAREVPADDRKGGARYADGPRAAMTGRGGHDDLAPMMTARKVATTIWRLRRPERAGMTDIHDDLAPAMTGREGATDDLKAHDDHGACEDRKTGERCQR